MSKKEKEIKVVRLNAEEKTMKIETIENELSSFQSIVGGLIEVVNFGNVLCIINEEGKFNGSKPNFAFPVGGQYYDVIMGDVFFVGDDGAEFRSVTEEEIERTKEIIVIGRLLLSEFAKRNKTEEF